MHRTPLRSAVFVSLLLGAAAAPSFGDVFHVGEQVAAPALSTYGMQVPPSRALRGILPADWRLQVEPGVTLSEKVSWGPSDTWLTVLERVATRAGADAYVDWSTRTIVLRLAGKQIGSTPAPSRATGVRASDTPAPETTAIPTAPAAEAPHQRPTPPPPVPLPSPSLEPIEVDVPVPAVDVDALVIASSKSPAGPARAFNRAPLREPLEALAQRHGLTLIYEAGDISLPGPLTLMLGEDLGEDLKLLERALGPTVPLSITLYRAEKELVVGLSDGEPFFASVDARPQPKPSILARLFRRVPTLAQEPRALSAAIALRPESHAKPEVEGADMPESAPVRVAHEAPPASLAVSTASVPSTVSVPSMASMPVVEAEATTEQASPAPQPAITFELIPGERLSVALERLFANQGWTLVWKVSGDFEAAAPARVQGNSIAEVLRQLLPQLGLSADLYTPSRYAVIRLTQPDMASVGAP